MLKLRITKSISTYGEYGIIKRNVINLQVKFKVSIFGIKYYYWKTIYSTLLDDIDSIKEKDVLNEGTHLGKYTKQELLDMTQIDPGEFLTCFLIYVCAYVFDTFQIVY